MAKQSGQTDKSAWQTAIDFGFDASQMEYLLSLTPEQRLERHERARLGVLELRAIGRDLLVFDPRNPDRPST